MKTGITWLAMAALAVGLLAPATSVAGTPKEKKAKAETYVVVHVDQDFKVVASSELKAHKKASDQGYTDAIKAYDDAKKQAKKDKQKFTQKRPKKPLYKVFRKTFKTEAEAKAYAKKMKEALEKKTKKDKDKSKDTKSK